MLRGAYCLQNLLLRTSLHEQHLYHPEALEIEGDPLHCINMSLLDRLHNLRRRGKSETSPSDDTGTSRHDGESVSNLIPPRGYEPSYLQNARQVQYQIGSEVWLQSDVDNNRSRDRSRLQVYVVRSHLDGEYIIQKKGDSRAPLVPKSEIALRAVNPRAAFQGTARAGR